MAPRRSQRQRERRRRQRARSPSEESNVDSDENTISSHLKALGIRVSDLSSCDSLHDEFTMIKRSYFRKILVAHPDKGGDPQEFRTLNTSFEAIRNLFDKKAVRSFATNASEHVQYSQPSVGRTPSTSTPSWEFYSAAAEEDLPLYKVELAKSGRSKCVYRTRYCTSPVIEKNSIRIGSINTESGSYGRWGHLNCWRVPSKIWAGVPDPQECQDPALFHEALGRMNHVLFCGFNELSEEDQNLVVNHVMNRENWAKMSKAKNKRKTTETEPKSATPALEPAKGNKKQRASKKTASKSATTATATTTVNGTPPSSSALVVKDEAKPSKELVTSKQTKSSSALALKKERQQNQLVVTETQVLQGKTVVMTGIFPEIGGGAGLNLGKDRLKGMLEKMGAKVRSAVSGKTDMVVVGTNPGMGKVTAARSRPNCQLVGIQDLKLAVNGERELAALPEPEIEQYSAGYMGNGLALRLEGGKARGRLY